MVYLKFLFFLIVYPIWLILHKATISGENYEILEFGRCKFFAPSEALVKCHDALDILKDIDCDIYDELKKMKISFIYSYSNAIPKDYFCRRFALNESLFRNGEERIFAEIVRVYFVVKYRDYKISSFYDEDNARSTWMYRVWVEEVRKKYPEV